ncbi:MAG: hypothetical protein N3D11_17470 [Candidatus Sumerlaeia bacterium]|nr:hypothetical protein [Candidatus Sumerlaeia bacterium]
MSNLSIALDSLVLSAALIALVVCAAWAIRSALGMVENPLGLAAALALSAGGLALAVFAAAAFGWIGRVRFGIPMVYWWHLPAGLWIAAAVGAAAWRGGAEQSLLGRPRFSVGIFAALAFLVWVLATDLLLCFEPQFRSDALWYHLTLPYYWVMERTLRGYPAWLTAATVHSQAPPPTVEGYPLLTEMLYTIPVSHGLPFGARILHLAFGLGVVAAIYGYLRASGTPAAPALAERKERGFAHTGVESVSAETGIPNSAPGNTETPKGETWPSTPRPLSPAAAFAVASMFFFFDPINEVGTWANTDLARAFFMVTSAALLARYSDSGERRDLVLAAVIAGLAMSTHYLALPFGNGLMTAAFLCSAWRRKNGRSGRSGQSVQQGQNGQNEQTDSPFTASTSSVPSTLSALLFDLALFWAISFLVFSPWLIKNQILFARPFCGIPENILSLPSGEALGRLFFDNSFFLGFGGIALWLLVQGRLVPSERFLSVYLLGYLLLGAVALPPIPRFFFPIYGIGLMLAGRLTAPLFHRQRWLEIALPAALLALAVAITCYQWQYHLYDAALDFLFRNSPPFSNVVWHR